MTSGADVVGVDGGLDCSRILKPLPGFHQDQQEQFLEFRTKAGDDPFRIGYAPRSVISPNCTLLS